MLVTRYPSSTVTGPWTSQIPTRAGEHLQWPYIPVLWSLGPGPARYQQGQVSIFQGPYKQIIQSLGPGPARYRYFFLSKSGRTLRGPGCSGKWKCLNVWQCSVSSSRVSRSLTVRWWCAGVWGRWSGTAGRSGSWPPARRSSPSCARYRW